MVLTNYHKPELEPICLQLTLHSSQTFPVTADGSGFLSPSLSNLQLLQTETSPIPQCQHHLWSPGSTSHTAQPGDGWWVMFPGISAASLLPELCLLLVPGLTLTSSGVGNSGILPPNSRLFPPMGRNLCDCYQILVSKLGHFFPGHSFYCFPPTHLHPNTNA